MVKDDVSVKVGGMKSVLRPTLIITLFTMASQGVGFFTQVIVAASFGARADMDAFLAANTLPQYIITVFLGGLSFVFIPIFIENRNNNREDEAWKVASGVITLVLIILSVISLAGMIFPRSILKFATPGLSSESMSVAAKIAIITWPTIMISGLLTLLTSIYQAQQRFAWQSIVPFLGALTNLLLIVLLRQKLGVLALAISSTISLSVQLLLVLPIILKNKRYHFGLHLDNEGVRRVYHLVWPLILSSFVGKCAPVVERFLASGQGIGTISHLGYALRLIILLNTLLSVGISTVIFPRMAINHAANDLSGLKNTASYGLRMMWLLIAPTLAIGFAVAVPLVQVVFQRGAFNASDSKVVAYLLQIYLISIIGSGLGNITSRIFYALKKVRQVSLLGGLEAVFYIIYTYFLAKWYGAVGIAIGYVLSFNLSMIWHFPVLRHHMGNSGGRTVLVSFLKTGIAAGFSSCCSFLLVSCLSNSFLQLIMGVVCGLLCYVFFQFLVKSQEIHQIWRLFKGF